MNESRFRQKRGRRPIRAKMGHMGDSAAPAMHRLVPHHGKCNPAGGGRPFARLLHCLCRGRGEEARRPSHKPLSGLRRARCARPPCPVGSRGWTTSQGLGLCRRSGKEDSKGSGRLAASCLAGFVLASPHVESPHHPLHHGHPSIQLIPVSSRRSDSHPVGIAEHIGQIEKKQSILSCYVLGGTTWKKGGGVLGGVRGGSKNILKR